MKTTKCFVYSLLRMCRLEICSLKVSGIVVRGGVCVWIDGGGRGR